MGQILKDHLDGIEQVLLSQSKVAANSGHPVLKGNAREEFINTFLCSHINSNLAIGTGEIIDSRTQSGVATRQFDVVIYNKNYPKINFSNGESGYFIESVLATIEVKSILEAKDINQAVTAAHYAKQLHVPSSASITMGWVPPKVLNYVFAFDGPAQMETVKRWIDESHANNGIPLPSFSEANRYSTPGTALDGVFVLDKGFIFLNNTPFLFEPTKNNIYTLCNAKSGILLTLFLLLIQGGNSKLTYSMNPFEYIKDVRFTGISSAGAPIY